MNIRAVAEHLGHNDPGFTLRVYAHLMPSSEAKARAAVDRALGGAPVAGPRALDVPAAGRSCLSALASALHPRCRRSVRPAGLTCAVAQSVG